jgi:hypothetical protein
MSKRKALFVATLLVAFVGAAEAGVACISVGAQPPNASGLKHLLPELPSGPLELIFFATWCAACKNSLLKSPDQGVVLIGTLDEAVDLKRAYDVLGRGRPCLIDQDGLWLKARGGAELPYSSRITLP